jgi:hypothetical protein
VTLFLKMNLNATHIFLTEQQFRILVECSSDGFWIKNPNVIHKPFELFDKKKGVNCDYISKVYERYDRISVNCYDEVIGHPKMERRKLPISAIDSIPGLFESALELIKYGRP